MKLTDLPWALKDCEGAEKDLLSEQGRQGHNFSLEGWAEFRKWDPLFQR